MAKCLRKECSDLNAVASGNDDNNDDDVDDVNSKDVEVVKTDTDEALTMLARLVNLKETLLLS